MKNLRNLTLMFAITGALIGGTAITAHAADGGSGMPDQTQTDGTGVGTSGGGDTSGSSTSGGYGGGDTGAGNGVGGGGGSEGGSGDQDGSWWGQGDTSGGGSNGSGTTGAVPASMAPYYAALGYYDGAYYYTPGVNGIQPTQGDLEQFNIAKGGTCSISSSEQNIVCTN